MSAVVRRPSFRICPPYTGSDLNPKCIARAQMLYGDRGRFLVGDAARDLPSSGASFDLIIVSAILHHLDDLEARRLFKALVDLVKPDGRIVTIDNVWLPRQNPIAKLVNALDSGMNVRTPDQYIRLLEDLPMRVEPRIYRDLLRIPYDHFCMTLTRATSDDARGEHP
jgi:SAM-dependent methyltransferase